MKQKTAKGVMKTKRNTQPSDKDKSTGMKGGSVNSGASRGSKPAKTPKSLGPRYA